MKTNCFPILMLALLLAGCAAQPAAQQPAAAPAATVQGEATVETPAEQPAAQQPAAAPAETAALDLEALCPDETEGVTLYISAENGLCLLYPSGLALSADQLRPDEEILLVGPPADPDAMESAAVVLRVAYNGPADGLDSAQYAAAWLELHMPGTAVAQEPSAIGGQPAIVINELPGGMLIQRGALVVANGTKYQITLQPRPEDIPELAEEAALAWDTVTQSIVFFPPQNSRTVVRPEDVCPDETADSKLYVSLTDGYCLLHPADFAPDPAAPYGRLVGGPVLGNVEGFGDVQVSLGVGSYGLVSDLGEQALRPISEQIDPASVVETTIGGHPAVVYDFTGGPWRQRNAQIVVGDAVYTFVGQPWDAERLPEALPDVERLWNMAAESIAFFDPWR